MINKFTLKTRDYICGLIVATFTNDVLSPDGKPHTLLIESGEVSSENELSAAIDCARNILVTEVGGHLHLDNADISLISERLLPDNPSSHIIVFRAANIIPKMTQEEIESELGYPIEISNTIEREYEENIFDLPYHVLKRRKERNKK